LGNVKKVECEICGAKVAGYPIVQYGICEKCLERKLQKTRDTFQCFHCKTIVDELDDRHLFCPKCGLTLAKDAKDRLIGVE